MLTTRSTAKGTREVCFNAHLESEEIWDLGVSSTNSLKPCVGRLALTNGRPGQARVCLAFP